MKEQHHNLALLEHGHASDGGRWSVLWGVSRKSVVGHLRSCERRRQVLKEASRLAALACLRGVGVLGVHDVAPHRDLLNASAVHAQGSTGVGAGCNPRSEHGPRLDKAVTNRTRPAVGPKITDAFEFEELRQVLRAQLDHAQLDVANQPAASLGFSEVIGEVGRRSAQR